MTHVELALAIVSAVAFAETVALAIVVVHLRRVRGRLADIEATVITSRTAPSPAVTMAGNAVRALTTSASRLRRGGIGAFLAGSLEDLDRWTREDRAEIVEVAASDGTTTIAFTDLEESTALNDEVGDRRWVRILRAHERLVTSCVERADGHIVKNQGDGFMIVFRSAGAALDAAVAIQQRTARTSRRELRSSELRVRIGIHSGTVVNRSGDFFGRNVAVAARVAALADGGQILATVATVDAAGDERTVRDLGEQSLKGIREPVRVVEVPWVG
jgi:adenylate cyclase